MNKNLYIAGEANQTPAFGKRTLFVVGQQPIAEVVALVKEHKALHVSLGANHSYTSVNASYWQPTVSALLALGVFVTLEYPADDHHAMLKTLTADVWRSRQFIPLLVTQIPHFETSNINLTLKIDDVGFNQTNPGVWCTHFHELTDINRFTGWADFEVDTVPGMYSERAVTSNVQSHRISPEFAEVKNDADLGIDKTPTSALKPEPAPDFDEFAAASAVLSTKEQVKIAKKYTEGTKTDALSAEATAKPAIEK